MTENSLDTAGRQAAADQASGARSRSDPGRVGAGVIHSGANRRPAVAVHRVPRSVAGR